MQAGGLQPGVPSKCTTSRLANAMVSIAMVSKAIVSIPIVSSATSRLAKAQAIVAMDCASNLGARGPAAAAAASSSVCLLSPSFE